MIDYCWPVPVVYANLTGKTRGFCCLGSDYEPIIVMNKDLSPEQQRKTYRHELEHIIKGEMTDETYHEYGDRNE